MRKLRSILRGFTRSAGGAAAIEFALVLPILATMVIALPDLSTAAVGVVEMESAARATVQYAMSGGTDMTVAQTVGMQSWSGKPSNAQLAASQACLCGSSAGTCGQPCADGSTPQTYITVTASGRLGGSTIGFDKTITRTVRIQ